MSRPAALSLLGQLRQWYARPALIEASPAGMPVYPIDEPAAQLLVALGEAVLVSIDGKAYLRPVQFD